MKTDRRMVFANQIRVFESQLEKKSKFPGFGNRVLMGSPQLHHGADRIGSPEETDFTG